MGKQCLDSAGEYLRHLLVQTKDNGLDRFIFIRAGYFRFRHPATEVWIWNPLWRGRQPGRFEGALFRVHQRPLLLSWADKETCPRESDEYFCEK